MKKKILFAFALLVALVATTQNTFAQDHHMDRHHHRHHYHHRMHHGNDGPRRDGDHHM